jgi:opacity protein-like surface antigen
MTLMFNAYLDGNNYSAATPYLTAGVGISSLKAKPKKTTAQIFKGSSGIQMAFNLGAGLQIQLDDDIGVDIAYRYMDFGTLKLAGINSKDSKKIHLGAHEVLANFLMFFTP